MKEINTHLSIILDRSGSMQPVVGDVVGGFNEFIEAQKTLPGRLSVSLYQFDDQYEVVYKNVDIDSVPKLELYPRGMTALYDAITKTVHSLDDQIRNSMIKPDKVIVLIITDGFENASKEATSKTVKSVIEAHPHFEFVFIGSNQDAILSAKNIGISVGNSLTYENTSTGIRGMFTNSVSNYVNTTRTGASYSFTEQDRLAASQK